jgi:hypothetical protein
MSLLYKLGTYCDVIILNKQFRIKELNKYLLSTYEFYRGATAMYKLFDDTASSHPAVKEVIPGSFDVGYSGTFVFNKAHNWNIIEMRT